MIRTQQKQQYKTNKNNHEVKGDHCDDKKNNSTNKSKTRNKGTIRRQRKDKSTKINVKNKKNKASSYEHLH